MHEYVIIGNGAAAAACIEGIRSVDRTGTLTVISQEKYPVYCRPLISYYLEGKTDGERMLYRKKDFYEKNSCSVLYGKKAVKINTDDKTVILDGGENIKYTELCIAAGSSPFIPPFEGLDSVKNSFCFMTLDDALGLQKAVTKDSNVLIVGAGLIGLKCAEGLKDNVKSITVCDLADRVLSSILDAQSAATVQKHLESNGIRFMLSDSAERFSGNTAFMKSGAQVDFDVLVLAIGVRANTSLVKDAGGDVGRGIFTDDKMHTSLEDIYAAGDCTEGFDITVGERRVLALMPNAYNQGFTAGVNMAGGEKIYDNAMPMNSIGFFGMHIMTAGTRFDDGEAYEQTADGGIKKLFVKDNRMTGFILIDSTCRAGIYTAMIREKTPLDSVDFELLKKNPTSSVYSQKKRRKMFGEVV